MGGKLRTELFLLFAGGRVKRASSHLCWRCTNKHRHQKLLQTTILRDAQLKITLFLQVKHLSVSLAATNKQ
jgi:hypothetical protein